MRKVSQSVGTGENKGKLLKGSDVAGSGKHHISGVVLQVRESPPGFGSPYIVDFDTEVLPGIAAWSCNATNARRLAAMIDDDPERWTGWGIVLELDKQNNPQEAAKRNRAAYMVESLGVYSVASPEVVSKTRKSKPSIKLPKEGSTNAKGRSAGPAPFAPVEEAPF